MKYTLIAALALGGFSFTSAQESAKAVAKPGQPVVQIAILLDNSGSMQGLIQQAKQQLWQIVNEFIAAKQDGKTPRVQVALYEYGIRDAQDNGSYVRQLSPLTDDLDKLSEKLFGIAQKDSGGSEFCGWVIKDAVADLKWDGSNKTYKAIFIAGNEPFTQGDVNWESACKGAISKGVIVNTIHCGNEAEGVAGKWKDAAAISDGKFLNINHNAAVAAISAPQDKQIAELNSKLNDTYLSYGALGGVGKARQSAQDGNAAAAPAAPSVVAARTASKASANYRNADWDLVDRSKEKDFDLAKLKDEELPEAMRKMTLDEKKAHLAKKTAERAELQKQIAELAKEREKFVAEKTKADAKENTLGKAVTTAVREQAAKKGVTFEK
jgi:von Willebrand factor type A domain